MAPLRSVRSTQCSQLDSSVPDRRLKPERNAPICGNIGRRFSLKADMNSTRISLLHRVRDAADDSAWGELLELYVPLVLAYLRRRGLQEADAADVAQDVLQAVSLHFHRFDYDPNRGTFRGWLLQITRNKLNDWHARRNRQVQGSGDTVVLQQVHQVPVSDEDSWNALHAWRVFHWAAERVRPDFRAATWQAFWRTSLDHESPAVVAAALGMTTGAVHIAKCRVLARIKEAVAEIEACDA